MKAQQQGRHADQDLVGNLRQAIAELPGFSVRVDEHATEQDSTADIVLKLKDPVAAQLLVECKAASGLYPRDVREWLWRIRQRIEGGVANRKKIRIPVLAADRLSSGVKEILQAENVGYYDRGGSLFLPLPGAFVLIDKPALKRAPPERSLFTDRRALLLHHLLLHRDDTSRVTSLALNLGLSPATVSETLSLLDAREWTQVEGQGPHKRRTLMAPGALLDEWVKHVADVPLKRERFFIPGSSKKPLVEQLATQFANWSQLEYAFTGEAAGQHYAPFLSQVPVVRCRFNRGLFFNPVAELGAKPASEGANFELIETDPSEMYGRNEDPEGSSQWFASPIQAYLDLVRLPGRAKELAAHLRREKLKF